LVPSVQPAAPAVVPLHSLRWKVGVVNWPSPAPRLSVPFVQTLAPQDVPAIVGWQPPLPLQAPVMQFELVAAQAASVAPGGLLAHDPADPEMLHAWQVEHDDFVQQTWSTQKPVTQSEPDEQPLPVVFLAGPQVLPVQLPVTQSPLAVQLCLQAVTLAQTRELGHWAPAPAEHVPSPLQVIGVSVDPLQAVPQAMPCAPKRHPPLPSQVPSCPQVVPEAVQAPCAAFPA
jgi:hypothetical protein